VCSPTGRSSFLSSEAHTLKLLAGRAFRAPTVYELFYNDDGASQIAAPNLGPETILTGEVEYTWRPTDLTSVVTSAYVASVEQLVDLARADGGVLQFRNREGALRSVGGELEVRREWSQGWMLAVAQSAQQVGQGDLLAGATAMNVPAYAASVRGAVPLAAGVTGATRLRVETGRLTSVETRTPVAALWDLTLSGIVPAYRLDWAFGVRNVLDWEASVPGPDGLDQVTLPLPGRNLYAEVGYTF
jgi:outer membrane receptor protein involved in Fe transport